METLTPPHDKKKWRHPAGASWTMNGQTKTLANWCRFYNMPLNLVQARLRDGNNLRGALRNPKKQTKEKQQTLEQMVIDYRKREAAKHYEFNVDYYKEPDVVINEFTDFNLVDADAATWHLKRAFNLLYKSK